MCREFIRVLSLDLERYENRCRKVSDISRDDHVCTSPDRGGEHMSIIRIGKLQTLYKIFVTRDERIFGMFVHEHASSLQFLLRQIGTVPQQSSHPFLVNANRPNGGPPQA